MTTILLARHGETDWNLEGRWQGQTGPPLNATGRAQAGSLAGRLADEPPDAVYSSDLVRSRETAEIVAERLGLPVLLDSRLREVNVGEWAGLTMPEIEERYPEGVHRRVEGATGWQDGETYEAMGARVIEALREIAATHPDARVLVVTHGGPMTAVWLACGGTLGDRPPAANCAMRAVQIEDGTIRGLD